MLEELARVVKIENHQVWIESSPMNGCASCQQKASCSTNAIGSVLKNKQVPVDSDIQLNPGDNVLVAIDERVLLRASLLLYFLPILALFLGAGKGVKGIWTNANTQLGTAASNLGGS